MWVSATRTGVTVNLSEIGIDRVGTVETNDSSDGQGVDVRVRTAEKLSEADCHKLEAYCRSLCTQATPQVWLFVPGDEPHPFRCLA
jgi:hypothetical protein